MRYSIYFLTLLICSCSGIEDKALFAELTGKSYQWKIQSQDTVVMQEFYFFSDSLLAIVSQDAQQKYAQFSNWKINRNQFHTYLTLADPLGETNFKISSWDDHQLMLSNGEYSYEAVELENEVSTLSQDVIGNWIAPLDSFPATFTEYEVNGKFLVNPVFQFTADSFNIRTKDFNKRGKLQVIDGASKLLILDSAPDYLHNKIILVEQHTADQLHLRLRDSMGNWKHYQLEKTFADTKN